MYIHCFIHNNIVLYAFLESARNFPLISSRQCAFTNAQKTRRDRSFDLEEHWRGRSKEITIRIRKALEKHKVIEGKSLVSFYISGCLTSVCTKLGCNWIKIKSVEQNQNGKGSQWIVKIIGSKNSINSLLNN